MLRDRGVAGGNLVGWCNEHGPGKPLLPPTAIGKGLFVPPLVFPLQQAVALEPIECRLELVPESPAQAVVWSWHASGPEHRPDLPRLPKIAVCSSYPPLHSQVNP